MSMEIDSESAESMGPDAEKVELRRVPCHMTESLFNRLLRMVFPDQRKDERHLEPPLVGYLGMVHASKPYPLGDISTSGFCLLTNERWEPGTEMPITLRRANLPGNEPESFTVQATVVRCGRDRVGFSIVLSEEASHAADGYALSVRWITREQMAEFLKGLKEQPSGDRSAPEESRVNTGAAANSGLKAAFEGGQ